MKLLSIAAGIFSLCLISTANAVPITKVQTVDQILEGGESFHFLFVDLAEYGFVAGVDRVYDWVDQASITFEFRNIDPEAYNDFVFFRISMDQGRQYGRVDDEDWVGDAFFNQRGRLIPYVTMESESAWLGDVTVNFELLQNKNVAVPEPLPLALMGLGLFAIGMRRYKGAVTK